MKYLLPSAALLFIPVAAFAQTAEAKGSVEWLIGLTSTGTGALIVGYLLRTFADRWGKKETPAPVVMQPESSAPPPALVFEAIRDLQHSVEDGRRDEAVAHAALGETLASINRTSEAQVRTGEAQVTALGALTQQLERCEEGHAQHTRANIDAQQKVATVLDGLIDKVGS